MHVHGQIYSGIEGAFPGRFAALVTKHEVVTLGKLGDERAQALGRAPVAAMSGFQIAVVHDCPERVEGCLWHTKLTQQLQRGDHPDSAVILDDRHADNDCPAGLQ
jgi:hypothetical protein